MYVAAGPDNHGLFWAAQVRQPKEHPTAGRLPVSWL